MVQRIKKHKPQIGIIKIGFGNINSVISIFEKLKKNIKIINKKNQIKGVDTLVVSGHGNFEYAIRTLKKKDLFSEIKKHILKYKNYIGICLGAQILCKKSDESNLEGLNLINVNVSKLPKKNSFKVPHIGWNQIKNSGCKKVDWLKNFNFLDFYFAHSYFLNFKKKKKSNINVLRIFSSYPSNYKI